MLMPMSHLRFGVATRRIARAALFAAGACLGSASALGAQASIAGAVDDSLAGTPLAGARVELVPAADPSTNRRAIDTDGAGHFRIDHVAPGRYLIGFEHPRLDELDM